MRSTNVAQQIGRHLREAGYFVGYGFDQSVLSKCYEVSRVAHDLPPSVKMKYAYTGPDVNRPEPSYDGVSASSARAWDYSPHGFYGVEKTEYPEAFDSLLDVYQVQNQFGRDVASALSESFGISFDANFGTLRLMRYPAGQTVENTLTKGIAPHTDFEAFTVLHSRGSGARLEILVDGEWIVPERKSDGLLVILGDVVERLTNGSLKATPHRVVQQQGGEADRYSVIRFHALHPDTLIEPLPRYVTKDRPAKYTPVTMRKHMETTLRNLSQGKPTWDHLTQTSISATYAYDTPA